MNLLITPTQLKLLKSREPAPLSCKTCNSTFWSPKHMIQKVLKGRCASTLEFCSRSCQSKSLSKSILHKCKNCSSSVSVAKSRIKKSKTGLFFCNKSCAAIHNNATRPKLTPNKRAYRVKAFKALANECNDCGYSKYMSVLQVHHKDKDRTNNKISNLEILCPTCHYERHYLESSGCYSNSTKLLEQ